LPNVIAGAFAVSAIATLGRKGSRSDRLGLIADFEENVRSVVAANSMDALQRTGSARRNGAHRRLRGSLGISARKTVGRVRIK
jgi:hypothetical protein